MTGLVLRNSRRRGAVGVKESESRKNMCQNSWPVTFQTSLHVGVPAFPANQCLEWELTCHPPLNAVIRVLMGAWKLLTQASRIEEAGGS